MSLRFAALTDRLNKAVFSHLSNAEMTLNGTPVTGIFDRDYALGNVGAFGVSGSNPIATLQTALVPSSVVGMVLVAGGISYTVTEHQPDGTGISTLQLRQ